MLINLRMEYWRKHIDRQINFTAGLNAIRGANENGKTSMLLAIAYALWGVKCLPLPMEELVTWTYPVKNAKVGLVIQISGEMYNFTRSTAGAECSHSGGIVTGQNEVSKFATELLGVSADMAMKLMFAPQGDMRGALKSGPSAISEYIEAMSGMDLFERLMDIFSEKLTTGPTTALDNAIADLDEKLLIGGPKEPDYTELNTAVEDLTNQLGQFQGALEAAETAATAANDTYTQAKASAGVRDAAMKNLAVAEHNRDRRLTQRDTDHDVAATVIDEPRIDYLKSLIADATVLQGRKTAYAAFSGLPTMEVEWEGDEASLKAAIKVSETDMRKLQIKSGEITSDLQVLKSQRTTASICGFCDQDMSKFPAVAKKNAEIEASITAKTPELDAANVALQAVVEERQSLTAVLDSAAPVNKFLQTHGQHVEVDHGYVPARVTWKGEVPSGDANPAAMKAELVKLTTALAAKVAAATRLEQVTKDLEQDAITIAGLKEAIPAEVDLDPLYKVKFAADTVVADLIKGIRTTRESIQGIEANKSRLLAEFNLANRAFAQVAVTLAEKRTSREELVFNNLLVKKVKAARPVVAAELWALVLQSVSVMFSSMRGEQSIVTKGPKGFLVNGRTSEGLSGSALDLLGFAIRVAMLNTFIPDCSFMILDEATAACDDDRTASLFGFVASAGFAQTILVTHDAAAEAVADNVIMI